MNEMNRPPLLLISKEPTGIVGSFARFVYSPEGLVADAGSAVKLKVVTKHQLTVHDGQCEGLSIVAHMIHLCDPRCP